MYIGDTHGAFGYVDTALNAAEDFTSSVTLTANTYYNGGPYSTRSTLTNKAQTKIFIMTSYVSSPGIYASTSPAASSSLTETFFFSAQSSSVSQRSGA